MKVAGAAESGRSSSPDRAARGAGFAPDDVAAVARALGHPVRVRIVRLLLERRGCIGCDIVDQVGLAQSTVSEHLRILIAAGVIVGEIERPRVCYSLRPRALAPLRALVSVVERRTAGDRPGGSICFPARPKRAAARRVRT